MCLLFGGKRVEWWRSKSGTVKKYWHILVGIALLLAGVQSASALLVNISATWAPGTANLQAGSIVQVVVYNKDTSEPASGTWDQMYVDASQNFSLYGHTPDSENIGSTEVYLPDTVAQDGHVIVATGHIEGNATDGYSFEQYVYLDNSLQYDRIYIRVFSATEFQQGEPTASYWGISTPQDLASQPGGIAVAWWEDVELPNQNYFEVIPEPGTLGMLWSGALGMGVAGLFGRGRRRGNNRAGKGDGEA